MRSLPVALLLLAAGPAAGELPPHVAATGTATARGAPDRAVIRLGVEARAQDAASAQAQAADALQKILAALKKQGVPADRISTDRIELWPWWEHDREGNQRLAGYRAATLLRVVVPLPKGKDAELGKLVDAAVKAGANQLEGIAFELADDTALRTAALREAAKQAQKRAAAMAETLGVKVGVLIFASDGEVDVMPPPPYPKMERAAMMSADTQVMPGDVEVRATVHVRYAIAR